MAADIQAGARRGVVVFVLEDADGSVRVKFDDVTTPDMVTWSRAHPYTSMIFDTQRFRVGNLTRDEFANVGVGLVARLAAILGLPSP